MSLEAEVKLRLDAARRDALRERLAAIGAHFLGDRRQSDEYFAHPSRDFAATDEALRLRACGDALRITYKGPKLDPPRKTREEIEFALATDRATAARLLERLGFTPVLTVAKTRAEHRLGDDPPTVVAIDEIEGLGSFCEVEVEAPSVDAGRDRLDARLAELGLADLPPVAESYLEMLLALRA